MKRIADLSGLIYEQIYKYAMLFYKENKKENIVMIGDRINNDIVSAKQLGMKTIQVKQGFGSLWNITDESEKADMEINNLSDILKYLYGMRL